MSHTLFLITFLLTLLLSNTTALPTLFPQSSPPPPRENYSSPPVVERPLFPTSPDSRPLFPSQTIPTPRSSSLQTPKGVEHPIFPNTAVTDRPLFSKPVIDQEGLYNGEQRVVPETLYKGGDEESEEGRRWKVWGGE